MQNWAIELHAAPRQEIITPVDAFHSSHASNGGASEVRDRGACPIGVA